jgi:hypothetical protein
MKVPNYPKTISRNCLYCRHYNAKSSTCTAPGGERIANFSPREDADCILFKYEIKEQPKENNGDFVAKYCIGTKCPLYFETANLCTAPSKCPYTKDENKSRFDNLKFGKEI